MTVLSNPYVLGYHGCEKSVGEAILRGDVDHLKKSENSWDWLGKGVYFWEADPKRGYEWAEEYCKRKGGTPMVIGAVIHLGNCLNLMDRTSLLTLRDTYELYTVFRESTKPGQALPVNDARKRHMLDCQVINHLHEAIEEANAETAKLIAQRVAKRALALAANPSAVLPDDPPLDPPPTPYNTVRGLYQEDDPVFRGSMIRERTHIHIAVLTPEISIQCYLRVPEEQYRPK